MLLTSPDSAIKYVNSIAHEGKVVVVGTDIDGKVWYSIKQDGFEESYRNTTPEMRTGWEEWKELQFPNEERDDRSVVERERRELTVQDENQGAANNDAEPAYLLRSLYRTQQETFGAPAQRSLRWERCWTLHSAGTMPAARLHYPSHSLTCQIDVATTTAGNRPCCAATPPA